MLLSLTLSELFRLPVEKFLFVFTHLPQNGNVFLFFCCDVPQNGSLHLNVTNVMWDGGGG